MLLGSEEVMTSVYLHKRNDDCRKVGSSKEGRQGRMVYSTKRQKE